MKYISTRGLAAFGAAAALSISLGASTASADTVSDATDCTPQAAQPETNHIEYRWGTIYHFRQDTKWAADNPSHPGSLWYPVSASGWPTFHANQASKTVVDNPAQDAVVCQITQPARPSIDYSGQVGQFTVSDGDHYTWGDTQNDDVDGTGLIGITATTDPGYVFDNGRTTRNFTGIRAYVPFPANPLPSCVTAAQFHTPAAGYGYTWSDFVDHRSLNGKVGVSALAKPGFKFTNDSDRKAYAADCNIAVPSVDVTNSVLSIGEGDVKTLVKRKSDGARITDLSEHLAPGHYDVIFTVNNEQAETFVDVPSDFRQYTNADGVFKVSLGIDIAPSKIDYGTPFVTHGHLGNSHIRGGDWTISSKVFEPSGEFSTYGGAPAGMDTSNGITRWRIVFTPDEGQYVDDVALPDFGTRLGHGFEQGNASLLNGKAVVLIYKAGVES